MISASLQRGLELDPDAVATVCGDVTLTYTELHDRAGRLVAALRAAGLQRGDRVAVVAPNCHRLLELYLAAPSGGFVIVPLNARHTEVELRYALQDSGAKVLFATPAWSHLGDAVDTFFELPDAYEAALTASPPAEWADVGADDLAGLFYTGGTTGAAKGVMLTHRNLDANADNLMGAWAFDKAIRWLIVAPMFHAAGTIAVLATLGSGGRQVILPAFDPAALLDTIEREGVTATLLVPAMLGAVVEEQRRRPRDVSTLRLISHGSAPAGPALLRSVSETFPEASLMHIYGATETAPILTLLPDEHLLLDQPQGRSCGHAAIGVELEIVDTRHQRVPPGEVGEVRVRGANVSPGYWNKPEQTEAAFVDGWYHSGDLGFLDDTGHLHLVDRLKDMIVSGGENVYSTEVELALYCHPLVAEVAVFGVPDERWGEAVHAVAVVTGSISESELLDVARLRIASYKVPKTIELRTEPLPKSAAGKILKRKLRDPFWAGHEQQIA